MIPVSLTRQSALPGNKTAFAITHGLVTATGSRVTGGHIAQGDSHASLYATAEVWLKDDDGREHHFRGNAFDNAREGHRLIVVTTRKNSGLLRVRNLSAQTTFDSGDLAPLQMGTRNFFGETVGMACLLLIPASLAFVTCLTLATNVHEALFGPYRQNISDDGRYFKIFAALLLGSSAWLTGKMNTHRQVKAQTLAAQIDASLAKNGWAV